MKLDLQISGSFYLAKELAEAEKKITTDDFGNEIVLVSYFGVGISFEKIHWKQTPDKGVLIRVEKTRYSVTVVGMDGPPLAIDSVIKLLPRGKIKVYSASEWEQDRN